MLSVKASKFMFLNTEKKIMNKVLNFAAEVNSTNETQAKVKPTVYLNIKYKGTDITLPMGLALDTMPEGKVSGTAEWQKKVIQRNKFLKSLIESIKANCKPGETLDIPSLEVEARVVNSQVTEESADEVNFKFF